MLWWQPIDQRLHGDTQGQVQSLDAFSLTQQSKYCVRSAASTRRPLPPPPSLPPTATTKTTTTTTLEKLVELVRRLRRSSRAQPPSAKQQTAAAEAVGHVHLPLGFAHLQLLSDHDDEAAKHSSAPPSRYNHDPNGNSEQAEANRNVSLSRQLHCHCHCQLLTFDYGIVVQPAANRRE